MSLRRITAILLALVCIMSAGFVVAFADDTGDGGDKTKTLNVTKELTWDKSDPTKATVTITTNVPDLVQTQVLFLGTLCGAHGMDSGTGGENTIVASINAIAQNADVTYYLLGKSSTSTATAQYGTVKRLPEGTALTNSDVSIASGGNHASLTGFINILNDELITNNKSYDYIVLEFDSSRVADDLSITDELKVTANDVANKLATYYKNKQVIWVTDGFNGDTSASPKVYGDENHAYVPTNRYYTQGDGKTKYLSADAFHMLCSVFAPQYYLANTTVNTDSYGDGDNKIEFHLGSEYCLEFAKKETRDELYGKPDDYLVYNDTSRQIFYNKAQDLADFLYMAIKGITLSFQDRIKVSDSDTVKITDVKLYATEQVADSAKAVTSWATRNSLNVTTEAADSENIKTDDKGVKYVEDSKGNITVTCGNDPVGANNLVCVDAVDIKTKVSYVKLVIDLYDSEGFKSCMSMKLDADGDPVTDKDGNYIYTMNPNDGKARVDAYSGDASASGAADADHEWGDGATAGIDVGSYKVNSSITNGTEEYDEDEQGGTLLSETPSALQLVTFEDDTVTLTYTPTSGYVLNTISIDGTKITLDKDGKYSSDVTGDQVNVTSDAAGNVTISFPKLSKNRAAAVKYTPEVKLSIVKSVVSPTDNKAKGGDPIEYAITVINDGVDALSGIAVSDTLDTSLVEFVSADNGGVCATDGTVSWSNISVAAGPSATKELHLTVKVKEDIKGTDTSPKTIKNTAKGSYDGADIEESKPAVVTATGRDITVQYSVSGTAPSGFTAPEEVTETYGSIMSADHWAAAQVSPVEGYRFTGWSTKSDFSDSFDPATTLDKDNFTITDNKITLYGKWEYGVGITKSIETAFSETAPLRGGDTVKYKLVVSNSSASEVTNVAVTDLVNENLTYKSGSASEGGIYDSASRIITWSGLSIPANGTKELSFEAVINPAISSDKPISNTATGAHGGNTFNSNEVKFTAKPQLLKVSYNYVGDAPAGAKAASDFNSSVSCGSPYDAATDPSLEGYVFHGWYTDTGFSTEYTDGTVINTANTTDGEFKLYGKWTSVKDFSLEKTVSYGDGEITGTVAPGSTVKYTIKVTNNNKKAAISNVVISDNVPEGLVISNISDGGAQSGQTISWTVNLAAYKEEGYQKTLSFSATVPDLKVEKSYSNIATVVSAEGESVGENSEAASFTEKPTGIPVAVTKAWSDTWGSHEGETVKVRLYANDVAQEPVISLTSDQPSWSGVVPPYDATGKSITYSFKELSASGDALDEGSKTGKDNRYAVSYGTTTTGGALISNDYVIDAYDLGFIKKAEGKAKPGGSFTYTLTVSNKRSYETATNITVSDTLPAGLSLAENGLSFTAPQTATASGSTVTWNIPSLAPGATATLKIKVNVPATATAVEYENVASITNVGGTAYAEKDVPSEKALTQVRSFTATKVWSNPEANHEPVKVQLQQNGADWGEEQTLSADGAWSYTWTELPLYDSARNKYIYTVSEISAVPGYTTEYDYSGATDGNTAVKITNSLKNVSVSYALKGSDQPAGASAPLGESLPYGTAYNAAPALSAQNYEFKGWFRDESCNTPFVDGTALTDTTAPNGHLTLYGLWVRKTADVSYENGSSVGPDPSQVKYPDLTVVKQGDTLSMPEAPEYSGNEYSFNGWYTDPECTKPYVPGTVSVNDVKLYAGWTENPKLEYFFVGQVPSGTALPAGERVLKGTSYNSQSPIGLPNTYSFNGWYTDPECTQKYTEGSVINTSTKLYGSWLKNPQVSYVYKGSIPAQLTAPAAIITPYGQGYVASSNPGYAGYTFDGWYTDPECTQRYTDGTVLTQDITLYGKWNVNGGVSTGDDFNGTLWQAAVLVSVTGMAVLLLLRKKKLI